MRVGILVRGGSAAIVLLLLIGSSAAFAATSSQPLSLTSMGSVTDLGNQTYNVKGSQLVAAYVDGSAVDLASSIFSYSLNAQVNGLDTSGNAHFHLQGTMGGGALTSPVSWTSCVADANGGCISGSTGGTITTQPSGPAPPGPAGGPTAPAGCNPHGPDDQLQCQAQFKPSSASTTGYAVIVTATYNSAGSDPYNPESSDSYTLFVGDVSNSPATSTSLVCDQTYLQAGQSTNCHATVTDADSSAETGTLSWSSTGGTITTQPSGPAPPAPPGGQTPPAGCNRPDHKGQMQCQAQFTAQTAGAYVVTATYTPADSGHYASGDAYSLFVALSSPPAATSTSLVCDQSRLKLNQNSNCHATISTSYTGTAVTLDANVNINSQLGEQVGNSELPLFFVGTSNVQLSLGNGPAAPPAPPSPPGGPSTQSEILMESPYFNPWGGPITITSLDGSIALATTYSTGTIQWQGATSQGSFTPPSTVGTATPVTGLVTVVSQENENLVTGVSQDRGSMSFTDMSPSYLNAQGNDGPTPGSGYSGDSVIPGANSPAAEAACALEVAAFGGAPGAAGQCTSDCTFAPNFPVATGVFESWASLGLPVIPGVDSCTNTGFQSNGSFTLHNGPVAISGTFSTTWMAPALGFVSSVPSGTVTQR